MELIMEEYGGALLLLLLGMPVLWMFDRIYYLI